MNTPIVDFVKKYGSGKNSRLHMPGHKGKGFLGAEKWDITEIKGADSLYEAQGIIKESEENATKLFGSGATFYSTEGSSQCIKAMLWLAISQNDKSKTIFAARNAHKAFLSAAALIDFDITWLYPKEFTSLCSCVITPEQLESELKKAETPPAAVYITSPDYLGGTCDIKALANVCHENGTLLLVDNAHGAYLRFLNPSIHPMDLGADMCCDSAHKTLPVLTGGAYLHIGKNLEKSFAENAKNALMTFGSTSPSYLTLASLDACNKYLTGYSEKLLKCVCKIDTLKQTLKNSGLGIYDSDPLKLTVFGAGDMKKVAENLEKYGVYCEYADKDFLTLMFTPNNSKRDFKRVKKLLSGLKRENDLTPFDLTVGEKVTSVRTAYFGKNETVAVKDAVGRVCACPTVSCPPAIPIVVSGEIIKERHLELFENYGIQTVSVIKE